MQDQSPTNHNGDADRERIEQQRLLITQAKSKGTLATLRAYTRLSGPGWLQSAITLGGGSLAGSLYLGVLGGTSLLWLQPVAMISGVIMLSAISYVTLSTGRQPFQAINENINPVLGWGWAIATLMANLVWAMPQFSLGTAAVRQNLLPHLLGPAAMPENPAKLIVCCGILVVCTVVVWFYDSGSTGIKIFEILLKLMVAVVVACFFAVVVKMSLAEQLNWRWILSGLIPDLKLLWSPAKTFALHISQVEPQFRQFWKQLIVDQQRDVMITAAATAVGINMTFLLPYSMLRKGWDKTFRSLAIFDLSTGLFIPFILATGCVVIASSAQFHTRPAAGLLGETDQAGKTIVPPASLAADFKNITAARARYELNARTSGELSSAPEPQKIEQMAQNLPPADKRLAAMLVRRDAFNLADSLSPLTGKIFAQYIFGIGVVGMAVSSVIILMLINGFVVCEMLGVASRGWLYRLGCLAPGIGILGPFIWTGGKAQFWLAVPTSVFGMTLLPIAYFTFYLLMNERKLLGRNMPQGRRRVLWNVLMAVAAGLAAFGSLWALWSKLGPLGIGLFVGFVLLALIIPLLQKRRKAQQDADGS